MSVAEVVQNIEDRILHDRLKPGTRMPSTRALSAKLGVAPGTIARAYRKLTERGLLSATVGRGTFVADTAALAFTAILENNTTDRIIRTDDTIPEFSRAALTNRWLFESRSDDGIQLMGGYGDVGKPMGQGLLSFIRDYARLYESRFHDLQPADGAPEVREVIAQVLRRMMCCELRADQILLGTSAHTFLDMTLRALTRPGDTIISEHPTYYGALDLFDAHRLKVIPVMRDAGGLDVTALEFTARNSGARLFYFSGSPSTPVGHMLSSSEESHVLNIHRRYSLPIIEDSSLWPFSFDSRINRPLFSRDEKDHIIHICSFSKWFFPSLRFAVAIGRFHEFDRLRQINRGITRITSSFPQFALSAYLQSSESVEDFTSSVAAYEQARNTFCDGLGRFLPSQMRLRRPEAGFSVWLETPNPTQVYSQCVRHGVYPLLGKVFSLEERNVAGIRVAYGQNTEPALLEAAKRIGKALQIVMRSRGSGRSDAIP